MRYICAQAGGPSEGSIMDEPVAFSREEWAALRLLSDTEGMAAATAVLEADRSWSFLRDIDAWDAPDGTVANELPSAVHALCSDTSLPTWITEIPDLQGAMRRSCDLFQEYAVEFILALLCKSLPECYAAGKGADVLTYTGQLGGATRDVPGADDAMVRRVMETAVYVRHVMTYENWSNSKVAIRTIQKVRMFHCGIRVMVHARSAKGEHPWDVATSGEPINQMDMAGTLLTFSLQACRGARALGVPISAEQERDFITHWIVIGHHLGIDDRVLRAIHERPADVWNDIATLEFALTPAQSGIVLVRALQNFIENHVFTWVRFLHVSSLLMEDLMEDRAKAVVLTASVSHREASLFERTVTWLLRIVHKVLLALPMTRHRTIRRLGRGLIDTTIVRWAHGRTAAITIENELREYAHV